MQDGEQAHDESSESDALRTRVAALEAALAATTSKLEKVSAERDKLRRAYEKLQEQLVLLQRRIFLAKAERVDARQLELQFAETKAALDKLAAEIGVPAAPPPGEPKTRAKPKGRRDLRTLDLPEERIELLDAELEGKAERIGFEESCRLGFRRGGHVRIVVARATYKLATADDGSVELNTVLRPRELLNRCMAAPSLLAHLVYAKFGMGLPFYRQEQQLASEGIELDRGTMCRYAEDIGASLGAIVQACVAEARETAFCLATDATGVAIQPTPLAEGGRQPCRKGHFFVVLADKDHVFFEYQPKHTSAAVCEMFRGYSGYVQADAHAIYDALFRGDAVGTGADPPEEVGCWSHYPESSVIRVVASAAA